MVFDWSSNELRFDGPTSKLMQGQSIVPLPKGPTLSVRLLIDKTSVEVFINQGLVSASFCFLPSAYIDPLVLLSYSSEQIVEKLEVHELASIWDEVTP